MSELPKAYTEFKNKYPTTWKAYDALGAAIHSEGPLDARARELVKIGIAIGARMEGGVHAHVRRALEAGATSDEIRQVALLAITTVGFPNAMAARTWIEDELE